MIECQRKQMLNLLSLKQIYSIIVYATPHRILNSIRGVIRYREEDLDDPTDDDICPELTPRGVAYVKTIYIKKKWTASKTKHFPYYI